MKIKRFGDFYKQESIVDDFLSSLNESSGGDDSEILKRFKEEFKEEKEQRVERQVQSQESRNEELELDEYNMDVDNLEETDMKLEELGIYEVYELINTKIKENIIQNIRNILITKKIKTKLDLAEMVDDEEEE